MQKLPQNYAIMIQNATNIKTICLSQALKLTDEAFRQRADALQNTPHHATSEQKKNRQRKNAKKS